MAKDNDRLGKKIQNLKPGSIRWYWNFYFYDHPKTRVCAKILLVLCALFLIKTVWHSFKTKDIQGGLVLPTTEEFYESLKETESDITGMSRYDKHVKGLDYRDGSDTDHDGLTDKEEIEIYGTDPLKASTSGDLYTDGYKAANGMELNKKYKYANDRTFDNNKCAEVNLAAVNPTDFTAVVEDYTDRYTLSDWGIDQIYKGYFLYGFSGDMEIDVNSLSKDITVSDICVWVSEGAFLNYGVSKLEKCDFTIDGDAIKIDHSFESDKYYYVYVTGKKSIFKAALNMISDSKEKMQEKQSSHLVFLFTGTGIHNYTVYYNSEIDGMTDDEIIKSISNAVGGGKKDVVKYAASTEKKIKAKYKIYKEIIPFFDADTYKQDPESGLKTLISAIPYMIFRYGYMEMSDSTAVVTTVTQNATGDSDDLLAYNNYHTTFDPNKDELPFQNFGSSEYTSAEGSCAGIAYFTSYLFNQGTFPATGSYNGTEWDLSSDDENKTLMDPELSDYKNKKFVDHNRKNLWSTEINLDKRTLGEREFIKMIGANFWKENDNLAAHARWSGTTQGVSWTVAEAMMDRLDQGKVINVALGLANGYGHEVTVYDYYRIRNDEVIFRVYDCNIPQTKMEKQKMNIEGACLLQCKKITNADGSFNMLYTYYPLADKTDYVASSDPTFSEKCMIVVTDETQEIYGQN